VHDIDRLDRDTFTEKYLVPNRPILVRGALSGWAVRPPWSLGALTDRFGDQRVPLYDTLFSLQNVTTFGRYVELYTGGRGQGVPPYLRWFSRQNDRPLFWADAAFAELRGDWAMPAWLPEADYVFPRCPGRLDATIDSLPAKGIFICGSGGQTSLHVDPWVSDACLCQAIGTKRVIMFAPEAAEVLAAGPDVVDLDNPDRKRFPRWAEAIADFDELLRPGDAVFIPAGWFHTVLALEDSVSITWNFVHASNEDRFARFLEAGGLRDETVRHFLARKARQPA
jgi:hypothetical protein